MDRVKKAKPLTCEQYLKKFSRAVRWRLPPQESEEAIADYRELIFQEERDETKLVEELGEPVQAAHLLTDVRTYRRWLAVFALLAVGLFLLAKWAWTGMTVTTGFFSYSNVWYSVWVMAVGLVLSLYWFRRHGQKNGPISRRLVLALGLVLVFGMGMVAVTAYFFDVEVLENIVLQSDKSIPTQVIVYRELIIEGGWVGALIAFAGLVLAKCYDRRWLALYTLALTVAAICVFSQFVLTSVNPEGTLEELRAYMMARMLPMGAAGLIGTGVALC